MTRGSRVRPAQPATERDRIRDSEVVKVTRVSAAGPEALRPEALRVDRAAAEARPPGLVSDVISATVSVTRHVIRNHRRFALVDVTFDGDPVGGATIDEWQNAAGADCWSARVLMVPADGLAGGALAGRTRDGRLLRGRVARGVTGPAPRPRGASLVEWHGVDVLRVDAPAEDA